MKVFLTAPGDRDVGISDVTLVVEVRDVSLNELTDNDDETTALREAFAVLGQMMTGELCEVQFEDECEWCCKQLVNGECITDNCTANQLPELEEEVDL